MLNSLIFFLPFLLVASVGIYQDVFALETITGYNYFDVRNPDGSHTWKSHEPYILNNGVYVPFINSGLQTQTDMATVILNADGSYTWAGKFTDKIIAKYADVSNLNSWTYLNSLNNDVPDVSWNGNTFVSSKVKAGIGQLDYKYVLIDGEWKTQLEATNLSGLTTKAFGFDQIIELESDTISFGGVTKNLDNFNGTKFGKQFLIDNKGKVLDLLDGINFDFDLGFKNLYSVTVYDIGVNKSRLVFDYRTSVPLLPNETLIIDPTFSSNNPTVDGWLNEEDNNNICDGNGVVKYTATTTVNVGLAATADGNDCSKFFTEWDISTIPAGSTVTNSSMTFEVTAIGTTPSACDYIGLGINPTTGSAAALTYDIQTGGTVLVNADSTCQTVGNYKSIDFGATGDTYFQTRIANATTWAGIGIKSDADTGAVALDASNHEIIIATEENAGPDPAPTLTITYVSHQLPPDKITNLSNSTNPTIFGIGLNWTAPTVYGGQSIIGYQINVTTPQTNSPLVLVNDTGTTTTNYNVTGLVDATGYSTSVSAWTNNTNGHPFNNATSNIFNFTTATAEIFSGIAPTNFLMLPNGTSSSILNLNWTSSTMNNLNGYRIQCEAPVGGGFSTVVSNTTTAGTTYNRTGLVVNTYYNCKVAGLNGTGTTTYSNTYSQTTFHLPDAVDDLVATPSNIINVVLTFTQPDTLYGYLTGYNINYSTPQSNDPLTVYVTSTGSSNVAYTLTGLSSGDGYSFRVAAITIHGKNVTGANVANATTFDNFSIGTIVVPTGVDSVPRQISFETIPINATTDTLKVTYNSSYDLACDFSYVIRNTNQTYSGLTENTISGSRVYSNFTLLNSDNDIIDVYCWDQLNNNTNARDRLGQNSTVIPLFDQINSFQTGAFGTSGMFGVLDLMTLIIVIVSMIGFNRDHPEVGVALMGTMIGACAFYGIIRWETGLTGAVILVVALAIANSKRGSSN